MNEPEPDGKVDPSVIDYNTGWDDGYAYGRERALRELLADLETRKVYGGSAVLMAAVRDAVHQLLGVEVG